MLFEVLQPLAAQLLDALDDLHFDVVAGQCVCPRLVLLAALAPLLFQPQRVRDGLGIDRGKNRGTWRKGIGREYVLQFLKQTTDLSKHDTQPFLTGPPVRLSTVRASEFLVG
jgi:hypothetical protein